MLSVPYHHQEHALSCEAASLRMLLLNKGIDEPENWILQKLPVGPMDGDPDKVFVGDVNGRQFVTGYGVHADGLLPVAEQYAPASVFHSQDLHYLIDRLEEGHPVEVWGTMVVNPRHYTWVADDGKVANAVNGEHAIVVTGYAGPNRAPTYIFVNDPIGGVRAFHTGDFLTFWSAYDNTGLFFD
jgi:uncharacterized protein YvpB